MDWILDSGDAAGATMLRREIAAYLRRHGEPDGDLVGAELVISELLANAVRHTAGPCWVSVDWSKAEPILRACDLGEGFTLGAFQAPDFESVGGRGLYIVSSLVLQLDVRKRVSGTGSMAEATLPIRRVASVSIDPPRRRTASPLSLTEVKQEGAFGRETFLHAVTSQLAQVMELQMGPAADAVVAQVAVDVGSQMEAEYRIAVGAAERLDTAALAECYVRLKNAIDGGFVAVEVTPTRIVLENDRCPFGDAVKLSPSLCRMTSAVFGGIAAGNTDRWADVTLEERIAVGDRRCRVIVELDGADDPPAPWVHRYTPPR